MWWPWHLRCLELLSLQISMSRWRGLELTVLLQSELICAFVLVGVGRQRLRRAPPQALTFAGPLMGQDKWLGGALSGNGVIYGIPGTAKQVLKIDPVTSEALPCGRVSLCPASALGAQCVFHWDPNTSCICVVSVDRRPCGRRLRAWD